MPWLSHRRYALRSFQACPYTGIPVDPRSNSNFPTMASLMTSDALRVGGYALGTAVAAIVASWLP